MTNPFLRLVEQPVETLTDAGWVVVLLAALIATWWAAGRNLLYLNEQYQEGWKCLVPFWYAVRVVGLLLIVAIDLWLLAAVVAVVA
jgi:hypothetical protein